MAEHGITTLTNRPSHVVQEDAGFTEVLQHTDYYVGKGNEANPGSQPHYRYRRYLEVLQQLEASTHREVNIDIGCGAGLFSWAFCDWATDHDVDPNYVALFGLDHSQSMIRLAYEVRDKLKQNIPSYPESHYCHKPEALLQELAENHHKRTDYTITFGHVLAQSHTDTDIDEFTDVIVHIRELTDPKSNCTLLAVDARQWSSEFVEGWNSLLKSLEDAGISYEQASVTTTPINDNNGAKLAWLNSA